MEPLRLAVVINGTGLGGAERMLARVLTRLRPDEFRVKVYSLDACGPVAGQLRESAIPVAGLDFLRRGRPHPGDIVTLARELRSFQPDVVQGWMYLGNLYGGLAAKLARRDLPVCWNIRHSTLDPQLDSRALRWSAWLGGKLARWIPQRIILNAEAARAAHVAVGYPADKLEVIPNGFDLAEFRPSSALRCAIRTELGVLDNAPLIGIVGRFHPHKDHRTFVSAAREVADRRTDAHFVVVGDDQVYSADDVWHWIDELRLRDRFHLLGARGDVAAIDASLDVSVCCSTTEGFPNVVGEAMACGVPCVVTDVGECAEVIGKTGRIVPAQDASRLSEAILELLDLPRTDREALGQSARLRIVQNYDIQTIVARYRQLWLELANRSFTSEEWRWRRAA